MISQSKLFIYVLTGRKQHFEGILSTTRTMGRNSRHILIRVISIIAGASVVVAKPYPASGAKQTFILDPTGTYKLVPTIGTFPLDPTGTYKLGPANLDMNSNPVPSRTKRDAEPDPFFTERYIPDGIYPAGGIYPAYGPTGIVSTGGISRPLRPTGIFTTDGTAYSGITR